MGYPYKRLTAVATGLAVLVACTLRIEESTSWRDQLEPRSPCYEVNLLDGLDESSTTELHDLFDCLNYSGNFSSLEPTDAALDGASRDGAAAAVELARALNAMPLADVDPFALAGVALELLEAEDRPIREVLDVVLELVYAIPAEDVRSGTVVLTDEAGLRAGILNPLVPVLETAAGAMLDDNLDSAAFAAELLRSDDTDRAVRTVAAYADSERAEVAEPVTALLPDLGQALLAVEDPSNDTSPAATGNSLRDLASVYATGSTNVIEAIGDECDAMLADTLVQSQLETQVGVWYEDGRFESLPEQIQALASVDVNGDSLHDGEDSALLALVRVLHDTNQPAYCELDLWVTTVDFELGNLAVTILETLANMDPATVESGVDILATILDWGITEAILYELADSGLCPVFTDQVVEDLGVIDLLADPKFEDLLVVFVDLLDVLQDGNEDQIPELADLCTDLYDTDGVWPLEELLRDIGDEPVLDDVIALIPVLLDPDTYEIGDGSFEPLGFADVLEMAAWVFAADEGQTGWDRLEPILVPLLEEEGTWTAMQNAAPLLADTRSELSRLQEILPPLVAADPELDTLEQLAPLLENEAIAAPLLRLVETDGVVDALLASEPAGDDPEVPLAFGSRLIIDGTVDELLNMVDILVGTLAGEDTDVE